MIKRPSHLYISFLYVKRGGSAPRHAIHIGEISFFFHRVISNWHFSRLAERSIPSRCLMVYVCRLFIQSRENIELFANLGHVWEGFLCGSRPSPPKQMFLQQLHGWSCIWSRLPQRRWSHENYGWKRTKKILSCPARISIFIPPVFVFTENPEIGRKAGRGVSRSYLRDPFLAGIIPY